ncbi:fasciclin domain-containing protein [Qipengyuania sp. CAU 1752]
MKLTIIAPLAMAAAGLGACSDGAGDVTDDEARVEARVSSVLANGDDLGILNKAFETTGLATLFDSPGASYTILAPQDSAFSGVNTSEDLPTPVLAAMLREHILPGHLDRASIVDAIEANGGPVTMNTVGTGMIEFSLDGETLTATHSNGGPPAKLSDSDGEAQNGVVLTIDSLLVTPPVQDKSEG